MDLQGGSRAFNVGNGSADVDLDVAVPITNGGLTKDGAGTMRLSAANTFSGGVIINSGVLRYNDPSGLQSSTVVTVNDGGMLDMNNINDTIAALSSDAGQSFGVVATGTAALAFSATTGTNTFLGKVTGTGSLTKNGAASQILAGTNTLNAMTINAGALLLNGVNSIGSVTVNGGRTGWDRFRFLAR